MRFVLFVVLLMAGLFTVVGCDQPDPGTVEWFATSEAETYERDARNAERTAESEAADATIPLAQTTVTARKSVDAAAPAPLITTVTPPTSASGSDDSDLVQVRFANEMPDSIAIKIVGTMPAPESEHTEVDFGTLAPGEFSDYKLPPGLFNEDSWTFLVYVDGNLRPKEDPSGCQGCESFGVGEPYKRWTISFYTPDPDAQYFLHPPGVRIITDF
ncbi:MAG: hypothetical protein HOE75_01735 [Chloroflexi bacterium]|nr:hypothetical protein [Chloroflexota bacterium]